MNKSKSLQEATQLLIDLREREVGDDEWTQATTQFSTALDQTKDGATILLILKEDVEDNLPISEKTAAFEKLLELGPRTPHVLRMFADHLWFHGPEWDNKVKDLLKEAENLDNE